MPDAGVKIDIDHWVHKPNGSNVLTRVLEIEAQRVADDAGIESVVVKRAVIQGKEIYVTDRRAVESVIRLCRESIGQIRLHNRMPRLAVLAAQAGLSIELPDTYSDGQARFDYEAGIRKTRKHLRVPAIFVGALTGFGGDSSPWLIHNASQTDPDNQDVDYFATSELTRNGTTAVASVNLTRKDRKKSDDDREQTHEVCRLTFNQDEKQKDFVELSSAVFDGRALAASSHETMVRTLNFVRDANLHMNRGSMPNMSQIINYTKLQNAISGLAPLTAKEKARHTFRVMGGNPDGQRLYKQDESIGANAFLWKPVQMQSLLDALGQAIVQGDGAILQ